MHAFFLSFPRVPRHRSWASIDWESSGTKDFFLFFISFEFRNSRADEYNTGFQTQLAFSARQQIYRGAACRGKYLQRQQRVRMMPVWIKKSSASKRQLRLTRWPGRVLFHLFSCRGQAVRRVLLHSLRVQLCINFDRILCNGQRDCLPDAGYRLWGKKLTKKVVYRFPSYECRWLKAAINRLEMAALVNHSLSCIRSFKRLCYGRKFTAVTSFSTCNFTIHNFTSQFCLLKYC